MNLSANATGKEIAERGEFTKQKSRTILYDTISLCQRREDNIGFLHAR